MKEKIAVCHICGKSFTQFHGLARHLKVQHNFNPKEYYDQFLKTKTDGKCLKCGNDTSFIKLSKGYQKYCSRICANTDEKRITKSKNTFQRNYGDKNSDNHKRLIEDRKKTNLELYGVEDYSQLPEAKQQASIQHTKRWKEHHDEYIIKSQAKSLSKYGYISPNQCPEVQQKQGDSCFKHYGVRNCQQAKEVRNRTENTCIDKYGSKCPLANKEVRAKGEQTCLKQFGVRNAMQCHEIVKKNRKKFYINGKKYDSSWEYKYECYLIEHGIIYEYQPNIEFWYEFQGKQHKYYPDFIIYNDDGSIKEIIDIKGDHLMKQMLDPTTKEHQKYLCMLKHNIKLLHYNDLKQLGII